MSSEVTTPSPELRDAWHRLLLIDAAVQDLHDVLLFHNDQAIHKIARRLDKALRGLEL